MYYCEIKIYLVNVPQWIGGTVKAMPPLTQFNHEFLESGAPEPALLAQADVIIAGLQGTDEGQVPTVMAAAPDAKDIWLLPMEEKEASFRFLRWQQSYQQRCDYWETSQFLNAAMDGSPNLVWFKDKDGIHRKVNDGFCRMVGKTKEQVEGRGHAYIWGVKEQDPSCTRSDLEVMNRRMTRVFDEIVKVGDEEQELTTYKSPLYNMDGSVMGTVGVAIDMTRERAYEKAIYEKNQTLEMLFSTMDGGVLCHSLDGTRLVSINRAALKLLGYGSQEELMDGGFDSVAPSVVDEDKPKVRDCIASLEKVGDSANVEYRVVHKDGTMLYILGNAKLVEQDGELICQRFLLDITDHKQRDEERLAQRDREFQYREQSFAVFSTLLSDNVDDVYMMMDAAGEKVEFVTPNIERVLGVSRQDAMEDVVRIGRARYLTGSPVDRASLVALEPGMALEPMETERIDPKTGEQSPLYWTS